MEQYETEVPASLLPFRRLAKADLFYFAKTVLGYDWLNLRVHSPVCRMLECVRERRVMVTMPRLTYKSTLCSVAYPLWRAVNDPDITMLIAMDTADNAKEKMEEIRKQVERNDLFHLLFPEIIPDFHTDRWGAFAASIRKRKSSGTPTWTVVGMGTRVISRHFDEIVMDDLLTAKKDAFGRETMLPGKLDIEQAIGWYRHSLSLLRDIRIGRLIQVGTRWAKEDLIEYILRKNAAFRRNSYQMAIMDEHEEPTFPERFPKNVIEELREQHGETLFQMWYMNNPIDPAEMVLALDPDRNFYRPVEMVERNPNWQQGLRKYMAIDLAYSDKEKSDNSAFVVIGVDEIGTRYVLELRYGKFDPMMTVNTLFELYELYKPSVIGMPTVAAEAMLPRIMPHFMRERQQGLPIEKMPRGGSQSKEYGILIALQPFIQQGMLKLPVGEAAPLETEIRDFRMEARRRGHDDALDALTDAVQLSQRKYVHAAKPKQKYDREMMDKIRVRLYSPIDDIEKTLRDTEVNATLIGSRGLSRN